MSDKRVFFAIIGGFLSAAAACVLIAVVEMLVHVDGGDDGLAIITLGLIAFAGIAGFLVSAKYIRTRLKDER